MFADICTGLISILTPETIGAVALGIFTGLMFGAIPAFRASWPFPSSCR